MKDTLFLTDLKLRSVKKDRLFYDQFRYCMGFHLDEASCLRVLDHAYVDELIERRKQWREITQQRWTKSKSAAIILSKKWRDITEKTVTDLHSLTTTLLNTTYKFKLVVSINQVYIYTNDVELIENLDKMSELSCKTYTQAQVVRPKNTIQLKKSVYAFRSYFKMIKLTNQEKDHLTDFLINQQNSTRGSPALQKWIKQPFMRTQDYFFVDHSTENWLTMLTLVQPGIIRKTMHIIVAK